MCLFTARGDISQGSSGVLVALLDQAQQLEPNSGSPVIALETSKKYVLPIAHHDFVGQFSTFCYLVIFSICLIHKHGLTGVVVKNIEKPN